MDHLIDGIYEAGGSPDLWPSLLQKVGQHYGAIGGLIQTIALDQVKFVASPIVAEAMAEFVAQGWVAHNVRAHKAMEMQHPGFVSDTDFHTEEEMLHIPMYRDFLVPRKMVAANGTVIRGAAGDQIVVSFEGFPNHPIARKVIPELDFLRPHLARAAALSSQLKLERARAMATALEIIGTAAAVLDLGGRLRAANKHFEKHLGDTLVDRRTRLHLASPAADTCLGDGLDRMRHGGWGCSLAVRSNKNSEAAVMHLIPVRGSARDVFSDTVVVLIMAERRPAASIGSELLQSLFDLTPAEARLAHQIGKGLTLKVIAQANAITQHTARAQLKAIFSKIGITRQSELMTIVSGFSLSSRASPSSEN